MDMLGCGVFLGRRSNAYYLNLQIANRRRSDAADAAMMVN